MKNILCLVVMTLFSGNALAGYVQCPRGWFQNNSFTHGLLLKMQGVHKVGDCKLELRVCNPSAGESEDAQVADALITSQGKEYYIPLYVKQEASRTASNLKSGQREVIFRFLDENNDPISGDLEKDRLAIRLNFEKTKVVAINLMKRNDYQFNKFLWWTLPKKLHCLEKKGN